MRVPARPVVRGNPLQFLSRALQSVLNALHDSRERQARRIIEDFRRRDGNEVANLRGMGVMKRG
jgi:hypothetical protein